MKVLLFTIATNGYQDLYTSCIQTQRAYAQKYAYDYIVVSKPSYIIHYSARDSAWLKIPLILSAFKKGYDLVTFIDADCEIRNNCPALTAVLNETASIYVANGFSKRINSGFIVAKNNSGSIHFFSDLFSSAYTYKLSGEDIAPYENGYFINKGKNSSEISTLEKCWNNNQMPHPSDFIRHYSGPMRILFKPKRLHQWRVTGFAILSFIIGKVPPAPKAFNERILAHFNICITEYKEYFEDYGIEKDLTIMKAKFKQMENKS